MPTTMRPSTRSTRSTRSLSEHASTKQSQVTARPSSVQLLLPQAQRIALESHNVGLNNTTSVSAAGKLGEHVTERKPRHRMNDRQLEQLETLYQRTTHPTKAEKSSLAREFDVDIRTITVWFQNKRQTMKRQRDSSVARNDSSAQTNTPDLDDVACSDLPVTASSPQTPLLSSNAARSQLSGPGFPGYSWMANYSYQGDNGLGMGTGGSMAPTPTFSDLEFSPPDARGLQPFHVAAQLQPDGPIQSEPTLEYPPTARAHRHALTLVHHETNVPRTPTDAEPIPLVHPNPRSRIHTRSSSRKENVPPQDSEKCIVLSPLSSLYRGRPIVQHANNDVGRLRPRGRGLGVSTDLGLGIIREIDSSSEKRVRNLEWACDREGARAAKRRRNRERYVADTSAGSFEEAVPFSGLGLGISGALDSGSALSDRVQSSSNSPAVSTSQEIASSSAIDARHDLPGDYYAAFSADVIEGAITLLSLKQSAV